MSNLVAVAYPDRETAEQVLAELAQLSREHAVSLADAVIVERREDGKVKLHQTLPTTAAGASGGALWGGVIGLLFLQPLLGMAIGAASGGAAGALTDIGIEDRFMKELGEKLEPGNAALFVLVRDGEPDKVLPRIQEHGGHVIQTSLSDEAEARLRAALEAGGTAA